MANTKAIVKSADMSEEEQQKAVDLASEAITRHTMEKDIAAYIKKEFDKHFQPTWHCIVGKNFGRQEVQIKDTDMPATKQEYIASLCLNALTHYTGVESCRHIKKKLDAEYGKSWSCVIGANFASYVTHETKHFIYFYIGKVAVLLFKSG